MQVPPEVITSVGLIGGFAVARRTRREYGGAVLAAAGALAAVRWKETVGGPAAAGLGVLYTVAFGASHPLAKKIGAWPAVLAVTGAVAAASLVARKLLTTRRR
jgi:hypothetical protein